ncbi:hybrid sensor histidine kinase/response regulator [Methylobacterium durans]|uniref:histidine kinase n=1 Tax=Methylobacterium durans TaxID=2202825 RepID=A0A2U8WFK0_9HYPH|nr:ATP-binding protein [Methylobacterium durans]AWN44052.1 hybrid sensor histidine kinase/response regulator [Methylobacterium durans]
MLSFRDKPLSRLGKNVAPLALAGAILLIAACSALLIPLLFDVREKRVWLQHTYEVLAELDTIHTSVADAEIGQREILLSHQEERLAPYRAAVQALPEATARLSDLVSDNPAQAARARTLSQQVREKLSDLGRSLRETAPPSPSQSSVDAERGAALTAQIRETLQVMRHEEQRLLAERRSALEQVAPRSIGFAIATLLLALLSLTGAGYLAVREIRRRAEAEAVLQASERRYRLLAENTSDIVRLLSSDPQQAYTSPAIRTVLGYEPEEFAALSLEELIHPDDLAQARTCRAQLSAEHASRVGTHRYRHKHGHWVWLEVAYRRMEADTADLVLAVGRDVTHRKKQEEVLRDAVEDARAARAQAEAASQAKTDFLAAMSHEIRTPLNGILGYTDLLLAEDQLNPSQRLRVERVRSSGAALLTVVNDILDFSKIEAGQIEIDPRSFSLAALVDNSLSIVRSLAEHKNVVLSAQVEPGVPEHLVGDQDRLRQILLNLLNNAVKFTAKGSVTLRITSLADANLPGGERRLRFSVTDTGIGIPAEKQSLLFERFSQVDSSTSREFGGTGLGLAISQRLIQLMGGTIGVESQVGRGSTFWFELALPLSEVADEHVLSPQSPSSGSSKSGGAHVLLAEDLEINQDIARSILEAGGHRVDVAVDGVRAVEAVQQRAYDLVLMDVQMPVMDGITAVRHIRSLGSAYAELPIVALTANVLPHQVQAFTEAGMNGHIGKPFKRDELLAAVQRWAKKPLVERTLDPVEPQSEDEHSEASFDPAVFSEVFDLLGPDQAGQLLRRFGQELEARVGLDVHGRGRDEIGRDAHALASQAGFLGFVALSGQCLAVEAACAGRSEKADLAILLSGLTRLRDAALGKVRQLEGTLAERLPAT